MSDTEEIYKTTCCYCGVGCGMLVNKDRKGKITVAGDPAHPVNNGMLCSKGLNLHYTAMNTSDRLLHPMFRDNILGTFSQVSWEEAMRIAAQKMTSVINRHGPDSIGFYISGQCLTEEYYLANKLVRGFIGTNNIDTNSRLCMSAAVSAYKMALGEDCVPGCYEDIELAHTFLIAGANPAWCHPILYRRIEAHRAKNKAVKIIVVDPRRTQTAAAADLHLQILPGTDIILFHAIARGLIDNGFIDEPFIRDHTTGFEALKEKVLQRTMQEAAACCGIPFTDIYRAVKYIGHSGGFLSLWAMGLNQSVVGVNKNLALINLSLITGKIGKPGSGPFSLTGQTNAMGGREVGGMATLLSAHRDVNNPVHRQQIADHWKVPGLPTVPGLTATEMFSALHAGKLKALWIICTNPAISLPDAHLTEAALKKAEFTVVQDISANADTLGFAHLVLPAATWLEKEGTVTNSERRISHLSKVIDPPGEALPDAEILLRFAEAMGWRDHFNYSSNAEIYQDHAALTKDTHIDISPLDYRRLKSSGSIQWPVTMGSPQGTPRLFTDFRFYHPDGKARIHAVAEENLSEKTSEAHPFILTTGRIRDQWHTMTRSGKVNKLKQHIAAPFLEIHPHDAAKRKIQDGDPVVVSNPRGRVQVTAKLSAQIKPGVLFVPMHWGKLGGMNFRRANNLTSLLVDPISKQPDFKFSAVQVSRYQRRSQKIVLVGDADSNIPHFVTQLRGLDITDPIDWICTAKADLAWEAKQMIRQLKGELHSEGDHDEQKPQKQIAVNLIEVHAVSAIDRKKNCVIDDTGRIYPYDQLVLSGGSRPSPGHSGIISCTDKQKMLPLIQHMGPQDTIVLTGEQPDICEAAFAFRERGVNVVVHTENARWMEDLLDPIAASLLKALTEDAGISLIQGDKIQRVEPWGLGQKLFLESGETLSCRAVVSFIQAHEDLDLVKAAGLKTNRGVVVNEFLQTSDPAIFAIGALAEYAGELPCGRTAQNNQAQCLAHYFHGDRSRYYSGTLCYHRWHLSLPGAKPRIWKATLIGKLNAAEEEGYEDVFFLDKKNHIYKKCVIQHDRLVGAIFMGDHSEESHYHALIAQGIELGDLRDQLLRPGKTGGSVAEQIICSCMQVGKTTIVHAIKEGCKTVEEIAVRTGAGKKCGSCKPELAELLNNP